MNTSPKATIQAVPDEAGEPLFPFGQVAYAVAILVSALAAFGPDGIVPAIVVCIFWASVFKSRSRPRALAKACLVCIFLFGLLLGALGYSPRWAVHRMLCSNNLKQLTRALHNYHDINRSLPPAFVADVQGRPQHSWRVLLLPFLEEQALYDLYDFDEPWNGPNNSKLLNRMPKVYSCPSAATRNANGQSTITSYVAVVGPTTAWPGSSTRSFAEFCDGTSNTVLLIEDHHSSIPWLEPKDLAFDEALKLLASGDPDFTGNHPLEGSLYQYASVRFVALADGTVRFFGNGIDPRFWTALLGATDGIAVDDVDLNRFSFVQKRLKLETCMSLTLFVVLSVFPLPWVWLNPTGSAKSRALPT